MRVHVVCRSLPAFARESSVVQLCSCWRRTRLLGFWHPDNATTGRRTRKPIPQRSDLIDLRRGLELCEIQWALVVEQHIFYQSQAEHRRAPTMLPHESNKHAAQMQGVVVGSA
jgi:hypothetical protein